MEEIVKILVVDNDEVDRMAYDTVTKSCWRADGTIGD